MCAGQSCSWGIWGVWMVFLQLLTFRQRQEVFSLLAPGPSYNCPFVYISNMQWSNNKTEAHTVSPTAFAVQDCYSHQSVWDVAQACPQWHLRILLIQMEQKGVLATRWNKQRKPKGKCSRQGLDVVLLLPAPPLWAAADLLRLADASFCPAGQKERHREAMDSWWKRREILLSHVLSLGSPEDWLLLWVGGDVSTGEGKTALVSDCATCHLHFNIFTISL